MNYRIFLPLLLFLGVAVVKKKQGAEKEGEIAVHNQRHAKSDPIGRGLYCPASPDRFSQKGIIRFQIGWGTCVLAYFRD